MKRFLVFWIDKFGLEWSDTVLGFSSADVMNTYSFDHPGCHSVRVYES